MTIKLYIDTNIFLDFYQSANDRFVVFTELDSRASEIIITEQTINEFYRNRSLRLSELAKKIQTSASPRIHYTSVVRELPEFKVWQKAHDDGETAAKKMANTLLDWVKHSDNDLVLKEFENLVKKSNIFPISTLAIEQAKLRKLLGNPPTSPDKHTIGDELIWEILKENVVDDLIVVSRDQTFIRNEAILAAEFSKSKSRTLICITESLSKSLELLGKPSKPIEDAEKEMAMDILLERVLSHVNACPKCGTKMEQTGLEGADVPDICWTYCPSCGHEEF